MGTPVTPKDLSVWRAEAVRGKTDKSTLATRVILLVDALQESREARRKYRERMGDG